MKKLIRINSNLDAMIWPPSSSEKLSKVVLLIPTWRHFWKFESLRIRVICRPIRINSNSRKSLSPSDNLLLIPFAHSVVLIFVFIIFLKSWSSNILVSVPFLDPDVLVLGHLKKVCRPWTSSSPSFLLSLSFSSSDLLQFKFFKLYFRPVDDLKLIFWCVFRVRQFTKLSRYRDISLQKIEKIIYF